MPINLVSQLHQYSQDLSRSIRRLDKLTIAAVNGYAVQIGLSMALACDYVIAARSATFGSATLRMGYQPDEGGHWLLVEHLGVKGALDFMVRKKMVKGEEAARHRPGDGGRRRRRARWRAATELAAELAAGPQVAMRLLKRATYKAARQTFDEAGDDIAVRTALSDFHPDAREGGAGVAAPREAGVQRLARRPAGRALTSCGASRAVVSRRCGATRPRGTRRRGRWPAPGASPAAAR